MIVILNTFSVPSVLLLITLFIPDIVWVKPHDDVYFSPKEEVKNDGRTFSEQEKARKIEELRRLKAEGKITDEEFNEQLFKLLWLLSYFSCKKSKQKKINLRGSIKFIFTSQMKFCLTFLKD